MSLGDLKLIGDTGWRTSPRYAPQDALDSTETVMHYLSDPSPKRTIVGYYEGDGSSFGAGFAGGGTISFGGVSGIVLSVSGQRIQNIGASQWWIITVELQESSG